MAIRYYGIAATDGVQVVGGDVIGAASGGTLTGGQNVQLVYDDVVYESTPEGKQRLLAAIKLIENRISTARVWPITSAS
ncbi:MAG: hypothetical protein ACK52V_06430 [Betaproteobacteria bacterium]|jgi:hypothetical protein